MKEAGLQVPPWIWYGLVVVGSLLLSIGGFFYGARHDPASDGGRGGALAVMLAFFALFVRSNFAARSYRATAVELPQIHEHLQSTLSRLRGGVPAGTSAHTELEEVKRRIDGVLSMIAAAGRDQTRQNICVALASVIGTFSWGFGDKLANFIKAHHWLC